MTVMRGECNVTFNAGSQSGDIKFFTSALRGCSRSGDKARRYNGDLVSLLFGLPKLFFGVVLITDDVGGDDDGDKEVEVVVAGDNAAIVAVDAFVDGL